MKDGRMQTSLILVVDPDPEISAMYAMGLSVSGWAAEPIADGREALAKAISWRPDVVVTETRVPGIDGIELCRILKRDPDTRHIPILIVTSDAQEQQIAKARDAGADKVLFKPCLTDELIVTIKGMLTKKTQVSTPVVQTRVPASKTAQRRRARSRLHRRGRTTAPPQRPPDLLCPTCDRPLTYQTSYIGGVSEMHEEQWDEYECPDACGQFQYRQRTRKLRRLA
jgi:CheY-like chemotaxis protein